MYSVVNLICVEFPISNEAGQDILDELITHDHENSQNTQQLKQINDKQTFLCEQRFSANFV